LKREPEGGDGDDLYDAAIEPSGTVGGGNGERRSESIDTTSAGYAASNTTTASVTGGSVLGGVQREGRKYCCYVGNMHWWTTDAELEVGDDFSNKLINKKTPPPPSLESNPGRRRE